MLKLLQCLVVAVPSLRRHFVVLEEEGGCLVLRGKGMLVAAVEEMFRVSAVWVMTRMSVRGERRERRVVGNDVDMLRSEDSIYKDAVGFRGNDGINVG